MPRNAKTNNTNVWTENNSVETENTSSRFLCISVANNLEVRCSQMKKYKRLNCKKCDTCQYILPIWGKCSLYCGTRRWFQTKPAALHKKFYHQLPHILKKLHKKIVTHKLWLWKKLTFSPAYASRTYILLLVVVRSIDLPSLLNLISQTSAVSPPTRKVSNGPYTSMVNVKVVKLWEANRKITDMNLVIRTRIEQFNCSPFHCYSKDQALLVIGNSRSTT